MRLGLVLAVLLSLDPPATIWDASPNYTASNREVTYDIDSIVIHTTEGIDSNGDGYYSECYTQAVNWFNNPSAGVSAHYVISPSGEITQMVADDDIAWHATYYNKRSIGIECAGFAGSAATWTPELLASLTDLVAWLVQQYGVPAVHPTDDANDWGGWYGGTGVIGHDQVQTPGSTAAATYSTRTDPGPYFPWDSFMAGVTAKLAAPAATNLRATTVSKDTIDFAWDASGADGYWLDLATSAEDLASMTGSFQNRFAGSATSLSWDGLTPDTTYYWRVWAYNAYGGNHAYASSPVATDPSSGGGGGGCGSGHRPGTLLPILAALALLLVARRR